MSGDATLLMSAITIAMTCHNGQVDKAGLPYLLHPLRVMNSVDTTDEMIVAVLHDVIEDSEQSVDFMVYNVLSDFPQYIIDALLLLTHDKSIPYTEYIEKLCNSENLLAIRVKYADLEDNLDEKRLAKLPSGLRATLKNKYMKARACIMYKVCMSGLWVKLPAMQ